MGLGSLALGWLLGAGIARRDGRRPIRSRRRPAHLPPRAKNVIFLHMVGAPSQLDLFDYKPTLQKYDGQPCPKELLEGKRFAFLRGHPSLLGTKFKFAKHGKAAWRCRSCCRTWRRVADDIAVVKTLHTEQINHGPAQLMFHTGFGRFGRPEHRLVGQLRPGQREPRPAGVRRDDHRQGRRRGQRPVGQRLSAERLSGRRVPQPGRPGAVPLAIRRA